MKKWMIGFTAGTILLLVMVYFFIPDEVSLKTSIAVKATGSAIHRVLLDKNKTAQWWPGKISNDSLYFNDLVYKINAGNITVMPVSIKGENTGISTSLFLVSLIIDSTKLQWVGSIPTSGNPVKRFFDYLRAKQINRDMTAVLQKMSIFFSKPENIYGCDIRTILVTDSLLITTSARCKGYPTTNFIYSTIHKLRNYAAIHSAKESGYPMLNIGTADSVNFDIKVALPIDKIIPSSGDILQKNMPGRCIILMTEVNGGVETYTKAFEQIHYYSDDHQLKSPAIPFYSLVTDRTKEPDASKWITKIYFPVMIYPHQ